MLSADFENPLSDGQQSPRTNSPSADRVAGTLEALEAKCRSIGLAEVDISAALANADVEEALNDLIEARTVAHHYREWAIICSHEEALGADKATGKPEVMVEELIKRLQALGLQVEGHPAPLQTSYILQISAPEDTLLFWATQMELPMRLKGDPSKNRLHADFGGMVPFKASKRDEFQANKHPHHEYSVFDSGARQRIVKHILENDVDGIDLDESIHTKSDYHRKGLLGSVAAAGAGALGDIANTATGALGDIADAAATQASRAGNVVGADKLISGVMDGVQAAQDLGSQALHVVEGGTGIELHSLAVGGDSKDGHGLFPLPKLNREGKVVEQHHQGSLRLWSCIHDYFPLIDEHEMDFLVSAWADPRLILRTVKKSKSAVLSNQNFGDITVQPIEEIRDYFGEQIGLYFAFLRVYTDSLVFPTVIGAATMLGHLRNGVEGNPLSLAYSILVSFWSVAFIAKWHRRQAELCFLWGTATFEENEKTRKQFRLREREIKYQVDEFTGKEEAVPKNPHMLYYRSATSILVGAFFIFTVVIAALCAEYVRLLSKPEQLGAYSRVVGSSLNAFAIMILSKIYGAVARVLTEWENHRVQSAYENSLIMKFFAFEFANNYFNLFFIALFKEGTLMGLEMTCRETQLDCDADDDYMNADGSRACVDGKISVYSCMEDLQLQLLIVFAAKQFAMKIAEYAVPLTKAAAAEQSHKLQYKLRKDSGHNTIDDAVNDVNNQLTKADYDGVFMDYSELAIQFGYSTLFAVAFPLAPAMCALSNIIEQRLDAYKLCRVFRRPNFETRENIGAWGTVFDALAVGAVITNALLVGFVGSQMSDALSVHASGRPERLGNHRLWAAAVAIEHVILFFRFVVKTVLPEEPGWVGKAKVQLEASIKQRMRTVEEETEELLEISSHRASTVNTAVVSAAIASKIHKLMVRRAGTGLSEDMRSMLVQLYYALDDNMSGTLKKDELEFYCQEHMLPDDVLSYDVDGSGVLTLSEWLEGWTHNPLSEVKMADRVARTTQALIDDPQRTYRGRNDGTLFGKGVTLHMRAAVEAVEASTMNLAGTQGNRPVLEPEPEPEPEPELPA